MRVCVEKGIKIIERVLIKLNLMPKLMKWFAVVLLVLAFSDMCSVYMYTSYMYIYILRILGQNIVDGITAIKAHCSFRVACILLSILLHTTCM